MPSFDLSSLLGEEGTISDGDFSSSENRTVLALYSSSPSLLRVEDNPLF